MVLIVAEADDLHAHAVASVLTDQYNLSTHQLSMEQFPTSATGTFRVGEAISGTFQDESGTVDFNQVRSIWWRRPRLYEAPAQLSDTERSFREAEVNHFLQGLLWSQKIRWVNDPLKNRFAARKIVQLERASGMELPVPRTVITNNPTEVYAFIESIENDVIFKRTGTSSGSLTKTTLLTPETLDRLDSVRTTPTVFQEYIEPQCDLRITWIDGEFWPVEVDTASSSVPEDSRFDYSVEYTRHELPDDVEEKLRKLMNDLGLLYAAIDMRLSADGTYYFLEINPSGQFIYVELLTELPLTEAVAAALTKPA